MVSWNAKMNGVMECWAEWCHGMLRWMVS